MPGQQEVAKLSPTVQNYLKAIYEIDVQGSEVNTNEIAVRLDVSPASVSSMLKRLTATEPPLIEYQKHRLIQLTQAGRQAALRLIRRHRLIELFLIEILGYSWEDVHAEAEILEHAISSKLEESIAHLLGNPAYGPNGKPIPSATLELPDQELIPLAQMKTGQSGWVRQVNDRNPDLLRYLEKLHLTPQTRIEVVEKLPFDNNLSLRIGKQEEPVYLGPNVTQEIMVLPDKKKPERLAS